MERSYWLRSLVIGLKANKIFIGRFEKPTFGNASFSFLGSGFMNPTELFSELKDEGSFLD